MGKSTKKIYDVEYTDAFMFGTSHDCKNNRHNMYARRQAKRENSRAIRRWNKEVINESMDAKYEDDYTWQCFKNYWASPDYAYERDENNLDYESYRNLMDYKYENTPHVQTIPEFTMPEEPRIIPMHSEYNEGLCKDWEVSAAIACMILILMLSATI